MPLDRKFFLIISTSVLLLVLAGVFYATTRLQLIVAGSQSLQDRSDFIASVERGERSLTAAQATGIVRFALDTELKRTSAIAATRQLLLLLASIGVVGCVILAWTIRHIPRVLATRSRVLFTVIIALTLPARGAVGQGASATPPHSSGSRNPPSSFILTAVGETRIPVLLPGRSFSFPTNGSRESTASLTLRTRSAE